MKQTSQRNAGRYEGKNDIRHTSFPWKIIPGNNKVRIIFINTMKTYTNSGGKTPRIHLIGSGWRFVVTITFRPRLFRETSPIFVEFEADLVQKVSESFGADGIL
jgi:hypothetical protein